MGRALNQGFSLVELLVALAVGAVLIGIGIPAFNNFVDQQRLTTHTNDMIGALAYARSEAVKLGGVVSVVAMAADDSNEWGGGYCIAVGTPDNCNGTILRAFEPADSVVIDGIDDLNGVDIFSFNARGILVSGQAGDLQVCSTEDAINNGRTISVSLIGRTNSQELTCP